MTAEQARRARVGLYARVSTKGQDPGMQLAELHQVAEQRGWTVAAEYVDTVTGAKDSRPALDLLMADARTGKLDVVAVWKFDRFARSTRHLVNALEEFKSINVEFISLREQVDTATPMGKAMFVIISAIAELERDLIRERVRAGIARARAKGKTLGRPARVAIDHGKVAELLAQGMSGRAIARELGAPPTSVRRVIRALRQKPSDVDAENPPSSGRESPGSQVGRNT